MHKTSANLSLAVCLFFLASCISTFETSGQETESSNIGTPIQNFQLKDTDGAIRSLAEFKDSQCIVVVFMGWECPLVRQYTPRLNELRTEFKDQSVSWLAINSNQHDSLTELQNFVRSFDVPFPVLKDPGNKIADRFGAERTPEVFVLDAQRRIRYRGRVDDQYTYGRQRPEVITRFLADALNELLAGNKIATPLTESEGCIIGRVFKDESNRDLTVTYTNQISRIMQNNCTSCHRAGEIGPFELSNYDEVVGWAGMIQEVVNERRMPPWHADPQHGSFSNDCRLSEDEISMINQWVENGAPEGNVSQLPEPRHYTTGWQIGEPDLVVPMAKRPFRVPARGTLPYEYFEVDPGFTEDRWVAAAECRLGNRAVIHHIIVGIKDEGDFGRGVHDQAQSDWIAATAPGSPPMLLPPGYAKKIPAGSALIFQMHYTPNGTATNDLSKVGLKFIDAADVTHQVLTLKAHNEDFEIPPGAENYRVNARFRFPRQAELLELFPHMHLRGKSFKYTAIYPNDGGQEVLLDVPSYDFNWQNAYRLSEPKKIPAGTRMQCVAHFDNSENNLANPDPSKPVGWGDQTWDEMMIGYFNVAIPKK